VSCCGAEVDGGGFLPDTLMNETQSPGIGDEIPGCNLLIMVVCFEFRKLLV